MIRVDVRDAVNGMRTKYKQLGEPEFSLAIARAINRTARTAKTEASRQIREKYKIRAKDINKALNLTLATRVTKTGYVIATGKPLPIIAFMPRQTKAGVNVTIVNTRKTIKRAFILNLSSGHKGVFARGEYGDSTFMFKKPRLPIKELTTVSVPTAFINDAVNAALRQKIQDFFPARLEQEVLNILRKQGVQ